MLKNFSVPDDATGIEHQGWHVQLSPKSRDIKITSPEDMDYAEFHCFRQLIVTDGYFSRLIVGFTDFRRLVEISHSLIYCD